jgi:hypothetical protein
MSDTKPEEEQSAAPTCVPSYDTSNPLQQEVTRVLRSFKNDILGITFLGNDGVLRSLTADRKVLSAEGLSKLLGPHVLNQAIADPVVQSLSSSKLFWIASQKITRRK